jgi:PTH1 family peptidyl-tRNA hydrolase
MFFRKHTPQESTGTFLLVGLGNPGREYENTRHNIGFLAIDQIAFKWGVTVGKYKHKSVYGEYRFGDKKIILVKPQTFMNLSGGAVRSYFQFFKPPLSQLLIIFDDLDLPFGAIRIRKEGGSSGQKGMKSIIQQLGTEDFPRMRVGIGRPPGRMDTADFILKKFKSSENQDLEFVLGKCADAVECFIENGIDAAMNRFNGGTLENE